MLTVAAIPVAMPTVLSVTMAVGARLLAKKQAIVSRLVAIEELAGVDVLCADKTGTLTQNKLTLGDPFCVNGRRRRTQVILAAALASRADDNDTIDLAVLGRPEGRRRRLEGVPGVATSSRSIRCTSAPRPPSRRPDGKTFKVTKGAPQVILKLSANAEAVKPAVDEGDRRVRGARLSFARRRAGRRGRTVAVPRACCRCSIRRVRTPRRPSRRRARWA